MSWFDEYRKKQMVLELERALHPNIGSPSERVRERWNLKEAPDEEDFPFDDEDKFGEPVPVPDPTGAGDYPFPWEFEESKDDYRFSIPPLEEQRADVDDEITTRLRKEWLEDLLQGDGPRTDEEREFFGEKENIVPILYGNEPGEQTWQHSSDDLRTDEEREFFGTEPVLKGGPSKEDTEHAFNLGGWLKKIGSSVLGPVNSGLSGLGDWMQKNPALVSSIATGLGRYAWDPDVGRGPMGGWSNKRALWNSMGTALNARMALENLQNPRGQLMYKDGGFYNVRPTNIGGRPSYSVNQLYQTPSKGTSVATGKVEYQPIGKGMQQGYMFNQPGKLPGWSKWGKPKPLYEPKEPKAKKPPESRTRILPGGKEQLEIFNTTTEKWVPSGDPYDPKLLSAEALAQKQKTRPKTEINLADKGWSEFNKQQAKNVFEMKTDAEGALAGLSSLRESKKLLDSGVITGTGAEWVTAFGNALKTLGWGDMDGVANTQAFMASMGNQVAQIIKQFGAGTGLSDADRDYAEKIVGGKITMSEEAIRRLMDINEKAFKFKIDRYNEVAKSIMGSPNAKQMLFPLTQLEIPTTTEEPWRVWLHNNPGRAEEYKNKTITVQEGSYRGKYTARQLPDGSWQWFKE